MIKENSGKARRQRRIAKIVFRLGFCCFCFALAFFLCRWSKTESENSFQHGRPNIIKRATPKNRSSRNSNNNSITAIAENGILRHASWHLINIHVPQGSLSDSSYYKGIKGMFCPLDWSLYKQDPSQIPFFKDLVSHSCKEQTYSVDLQSIVKRARESDSDKGIKTMEPSGFIFHESRCGSTLVSNVLAAAWSNTRVYSESTPLIHALKACEIQGDDICHPEALQQLIRHVMYLLGRTSDPLLSKMFFKIQSVGIAPGLEIMSSMYPSVPWIFLYRRPVQVMMSYWREGDKSASVCTRGYQEVKRGLYQHGGAHDATVALIENKLGRNYHNLSKQQYCAATLATFCDAALQARRQTGTGYMVNHDGLKETLLKTVFPLDFGLEMGIENRQKAEQVFGVYSKKRRRGATGEWIQDSLEKEEAATEEVKTACKQFLLEPYNELEQLALESEQTTSK